ncbi:MAG: hypothetical protein A3I73_05520 [Omnitrophica bacterium RIFCSPLOWO2_02_FULL_45_16]|nr:MAG: hypothetical protein A3C51_03260 [Omnitrophica bacterium RIFCSPHIGHO2_02_FULL_46_20]OGX00523.1 MAG: hypothetical protein A3I73_05520 [Omnitrophica bacterium RIFCSPLOWO2_02_FULL_45_16]
MAIVKIETKLPEVSLQGTKKQLRKAEKALDSIRHIKQAPKSIHKIRKWQRQKDKQIKTLVKVIEVQWNMIEKILNGIEDLKNRDIMLMTAMVKHIAKLQLNQELQESEVKKILRSRSKYSEPLANYKPDLNNLIRAAAFKK